MKEYRIEEYGLIGICETAALINPDGGIDWLCLPGFDGGSFFGALRSREGRHFFHSTGGSVWGCADRYWFWRGNARSWRACPITSFFVGRKVIV